MDSQDAVFTNCKSQKIRDSTTVLSNNLLATSPVKSIVNPK